MTLLRCTEASAALGFRGDRREGSAVGVSLS